ncbi:hypothetical protein ACFQ51_52760 [Streptomyces kaempferi]
MAPSPPARPGPCGLPVCGRSPDHQYCSDHDADDRLHQVRPGRVTLAGTDVTGPFSFLGAGGFQIGAGAPDTSYTLPTSKYPNTYASGQSVWSVEFGTDAAIFQVRMKYISTATMYRLSVDGRKVTDLMQSSGGTTAYSGHLITIDLGSAAPRRIRMDFTTFPFGGVYLPPTATMWQVPAQGG